MKMGRLPKEMLPIQSGVGNVANAVLAGLLHSPFENLLGFTEVLQDGMLNLLRAGKMSKASATAISLSRSALQDFEDNIDFYGETHHPAPRDSNHPELVRRLGIIAMNSMIEADIYGNINSTHLMGTSMMNGIGGSGDFARNGYLSFFVTPSVAKNGAISCIVPMVSHVDHTSTTRRSSSPNKAWPTCVASRRASAPRSSSTTVRTPISGPCCRTTFDRAQHSSGGLHTPHLLNEALSWHQRFVETGSMRAPA